ncbi:hypothetical protein B566_EDAN017636 [Ephemera danica]|nr:hypothetical protein B566_EDAN017636 [Ephemera danica]
MKVAAPAGSDDGGGSDSTCSIIYVQKTGERVTFKAMPVKTPDRKRKLLEHQRLKVQRRPPKPTPEYDALVVPWSDPMEPEDCSDITSITTKTETSGSDDDDSDSVSSWTSTITVQKPKATYSRTPQKIVPPPPPPPPPPPENTDGGNQGRRRLHIEELEIDFTIEELSRVECLHFYAPGYETLPELIIERYPEPEPQTKCRKMHELSDDWERFEV